MSKPSHKTITAETNLTDGQILVIKITAGNKEAKVKQSLYTPVQA